MFGGRNWVYFQSLMPALYELRQIVLFLTSGLWLQLRQTESTGSKAALLVYYVHLKKIKNECLGHSRLYTGMTPDSVLSYHS